MTKTLVCRVSAQTRRFFGFRDADRATETEKRLHSMRGTPTRHDQTRLYFKRKPKTTTNKYMWWWF